MQFPSRHFASFADHSPLVAGYWTQGRLPSRRRIDIGGGVSEAAMGATQTLAARATDLGSFGISRERGFLPQQDPLDRLPGAYARWEELGRDLPKLLVTEQLRALDRLPVIDASQLASPPQLERAMLLLSYMAHAYVWGVMPPARALPPGIAVPLHGVAKQLGRPPVLSYA